MAWQDGLRKASFRGVEFFIENHSHGGGRHVVNHEFPDKEKPFAEDLGRQQKKFSFSAYVLGDDYFLKRDNLLKAIQKPGTGELIHPYLGAQQVNLVSFGLSESTSEGRMAKFSLEFVETGEFKFPSAVKDKKANLTKKGDAALDAAKSNFEKKFSIVNQPGHVADSARNQLAKAMDFFQETTSTVKTVSNKLADLAYSARNFKAELNDLMLAPGKLAERFMNSLNLLTGVIPDKKESAGVFNKISSTRSDPIIVRTVTPSRNQQLINQKAIDDLMNQGAIVRSAEESTEALFTSSDEAISGQTILKDNIEKTLEETDDDELFNRMADLKAAVIETIPDQDDELPNISTLENPRTINSLVLSYDLYENLKNEQDIIDRNKIKHPGFILGQTELEVLTNE